jgi:hypothetical protein
MFQTLLSANIFSPLKRHTNNFYLWDQLNNRREYGQLKCVLKETVMRLNLIFRPNIQIRIQGNTENSELNHNTLRTKFSTFLCNSDYIMKHFKLYQTKFLLHVMLRQSNILVFWKTKVTSRPI